MAEPRTILCFGDSNTHGTRAMRDLEDRRRWPKAQRWPHVMAAALGDGFDVIVEGHPGRTAAFDDPDEGAHKNGLRALPVLLETHRPIDLVIILLGTNDTKARFGATATEIAASLGLLANAIKQSDAGPEKSCPQVLFAAPPQIIEAGCLAPMFAGGTEASRALCVELAKVAAETGCEFTDLGVIAEVDPVDGIHLDAIAQIAIGQHVADKVRTILGSPN